MPSSVIITVPVGAVTLRVVFWWMTMLPWVLSLTVWFVVWLVRSEPIEFGLVV